MKTNFKIAILFILFSCTKDRCYNDTVIETQLTLTNYETLAFIEQRLSSDDNPFLASKMDYNPGLLIWDVTPFIEKYQPGTRMYVNTRVFDWRDGSYYWMGVDTIFKQ